MALVIPSRFESILKKDSSLYAIVLEAISELESILRDNKLYFFEEYTDHGEQHINSVLKTAEDIIDEETFNILSSKDIAILVLAILLHDLGMHTYYDTFKGMLNGEHNDVLKEVKLFAKNSKRWNEHWKDYIEEFSKLDINKLKEVYGETDIIPAMPIFNNKDDLNGYQKKIIGEFIRRYHPRIAYEIALKGISGQNGTIEFAKKLRIDFKKLAGIVAYSHGVDLRDTFDYLKIVGGKGSWRRPYDVNIIFLMIVLRIADYFQFDDTRVEKSLIKIKSFSSPISKIEHDKHLSIEFVKPDDEDPETLYVKANPYNSDLYIKIKNLLNSIQYELDISWAVQGEIYGKANYKSQPKIKFRRIQSNINESYFIKSLPYVTEKFIFDVDKDILKLLISPLYGENPSYGFRELIQNATDACKEREKDEEGDYKGFIEVSIDKEGEYHYMTIIDNGKGMTINEIKNYFLRAGSSFRKSSEWRKKYTDESGKSLIQRSGKFGIGVLAAFLLGARIEVATKSLKEESGYWFTCHIDSDQIEVLYKENVDIGTKIKIFIDDSALHSLNYVKYPVKWNHWFVLTNPFIKYTYYGVNIIPKNLRNRAPTFDDNFFDSWRSLQTRKFEKIFWSYDSPLVTDSAVINPMILCNGIIVPTNYQFYYPYLKAPFLSFFDYNGSLQLNLSRNSLISQANFEEDLLTSICEDIIAKLLIAEVDQTDDLLDLADAKGIISHESRLLDIVRPRVILGKKGFILKYKFFIENLKEKGIVGTISLYNRWNEAEAMFRYRRKNTYPPLREKINFKLLDDNTFLEIINSGLDEPRTDDPKKYHEDIRKNLERRSHKNLEDEITEKHLANEDKMNAFFFGKKRIISNLNKIDNYIDLFKDFSTKSVYSIQIEKASLYSQHSTNLISDTATQILTIFDKTLSRYFLDDVIIPYDISERKIKFHKAFNDLASYIKLHEHIRDT